MRLLLNAALLVLILGIFFSCEKKTMLIEPPIVVEPCAYEMIKNSPNLQSFTDSFYFKGINKGVEWQANHFGFLVSSQNDHCGNKTLAISFTFTEEMPFCNYSHNSLSSTCYFYYPKDTFFMDNGNRYFRFSHLVRYEYKNNVEWDKFFIPEKDSISGNNYLFIEGFNTDTSIIWGAFQLKLVGTKSPDFVIKNGRFRCKTRKFL